MKNTLSRRENFVIQLIIEAVFAIVVGWGLWLLGTPIWLGLPIYVVTNFVVDYRRRNKAVRRW